MTLEIAGERYGRLTAVRRVASKGGKTFWLFRCTCGTAKEIVLDNVRSGNTKSCGCYNKEQFTTHGHRRGGGRTTPEYNAWRSVKARCFNPAAKMYPYYGGRGITMHESWVNNFQAFFDHMGPRPPGTSIDRIENDKGYEPGNCRWATPKEQARNRRNNHMVQFEGREIAVAELAELTGRPYRKLYHLLKKGHTVQEALEHTRPHTLT